jgi:ribosomal protein S27AE
MICNRCDGDFDLGMFYSKDKTCKECRKSMVKENRNKNIEYYRAFDRARGNIPKRIAARKAYQVTEAGRAASSRANKSWIDRNLVKRSSAVIVGNAVRDGKLFKPDTCSECGKGGRIHGHHDDYTKPLDVRWLCPQCHSDWHKTNGEGANAR